MSSDTPHPLTVLFARGTLARLTLWPALRLAVHASWGGPASAEKQRWLASVLVDQFEPFIVPSSDSTCASNSTPPSRTGTGTGIVGSGPNQNQNTRTDPPPDESYIEELLLQIMADEFDVALEDDSAAAVARDVLRLFSAVRAGDEAYVLQLEAQAERVKGKVPQYERGAGSGSETDSGSEWEGEDEDMDMDMDDEEGKENEGDQVPQLLNHSELPTEEERQVDEDGFTLVKKKGRR